MTFFGSFEILFLQHYSIWSDKAINWLLKTSLEEKIKKKNSHSCLYFVSELEEKAHIKYLNWPNKHPLPNKCLLPIKRPLYAVNILLDAP